MKKMRGKENVRKRKVNMINKKEKVDVGRMKIREEIRRQNH
jgi:hypothetical protein